MNSMDSDSAGGTSIACAAHVSRDVFCELVSSLDTPPTVLEVEKSWPTRHVYFLQHPAGLFFMSDRQPQDFTKAQVIPVKDVQFPFAFHF